MDHLFRYSPCSPSLPFLALGIKRKTPLYSLAQDEEEVAYGSSTMMISTTAVVHETEQSEQPPAAAAAAKKRKIILTCRPRNLENPKLEEECSICGKTFSSKKAMYGHMRSHPRSIKKSTRKKTIPSTTSILVTAKTTTTTTDHQEPSLELVKKEDQLEQQQLAEDLDEQVESTEPNMRMELEGAAVKSSSQEGRKEDNLLQLFKPWSKEMKEEFFKQVVMSSNSRPPAGVEDEDSAQTILFVPWSKDKKAKFLQQVIDADSTSGIDMAFDGGFVKEESIRSPIKNAVEERRKSVTSCCECDDKFKCTTCNKSFPTHQTLGGHRSRQCKILKEDDTDIIAEKKNQTAGITNLMQVVGRHQCNICSRSFPTGQALGGHKRRHWVAPSVAKAPTTLITGCGNRFDFDLNELPEEELILTLLPPLVS